MGIKLIAAAYSAAHAAQLPDRPARLLVYMAGVALDTDAAPKFYGGREAAAFALGLDHTSENDQKAVQRAITRLIAAGTIERAERGHNGKRTVYRLHLVGGHSLTPYEDERGTPSVPLSTREGGHSASPFSEVGGHFDPSRGTSESLKGDTQSPPKEEEEKREEERARASNDTTFDLDAPPAPSPPDSPFCSLHPGGTTGPCWACKQAREAYEAVHGKTPRQPRTPKPEPLRLIHRDGRDICADGRHKPMPDGTCARCTIRPDDLAAALRGHAIA